MARGSVEQCCERDNDHDGNCDIHESPGVLRRQHRQTMFGSHAQLLESLLGDALARQSKPCDHSGIGLPGCVICDPRVRPYRNA